MHLIRGLKINFFFFYLTPNQIKIYLICLKFILNLFNFEQILNYY